MKLETRDLRQRGETETEKGGAVSVPISVSSCSVLLTPGFHPGYDWAKYIADAALFPASDESSFAIGAPFVIDEEYVAR